MLTKEDIKLIQDALLPSIEEIIDRKLDEKLELRFEVMESRFEKIEQQAEENCQTIIRYLEGTFDIQSTILKEFKSIMVRSGSTLTEARNIRV